jgi:hypothetical protein
MAEISQIRPQVYQISVNPLGEIILCEIPQPSEKNASLILESPVSESSLLNNANKPRKPQTITPHGRSVLRDAMVLKLQDDALRASNPTKSQYTTYTLTPLVNQPLDVQQKLYANTTKLRKSIIDTTNHYLKRHGLENDYMLKIEEAYKTSLATEIIQHTWCFTVKHRDEIGNEIYDNELPRRKRTGYQN